MDEVKLEMDFVFLDTETTGLSPGNIAQLSMIVSSNGSITNVKNYFFEIDYITQGAEKTCGRGVEFYKEASKGLRFKDKAEEIYNVLKDSIIVCHNANFDENFLSTEFWRLNMIYKPGGKFDTMEYFRDICQIPFKYASKHGKWKNPKLEEVVDYLCIDKERVKEYTAQLFHLDPSIDKIDSHDAMYDTTSLFVAFQVQGERINKASNTWISRFCKTSI